MSKKQEKRNVKSGSIGRNCNKNPNKKEVVYPTREEVLSVEAILAEKISEFEARIERLEVWTVTPPPSSALFKTRARLGGMEENLLAQGKDILFLMSELRSLMEKLKAMHVFKKQTP